MILLLQDIHWIKIIRDYFISQLTSREMVYDDHSSFFFAFKPMLKNKLATTKLISHKPREIFRARIIFSVQYVHKLIYVW